MGITGPAYLSERGDSQKEVQDNSTILVTYKDVYIVPCDTYDVSDSAIQTAFGVPQEFMQHPSDPFARVSDLSCKRIESLYDQAVTVTYKSNPNDPNDPRNKNPNKPDKPEDNPLLAPVAVSRDYVEREEILLGDKYSESGPDTSRQPIKNGAGTPFVPAPTKIVYEPVLRVVRNETNFLESTSDDYTGAVNSDVFRGWPAGTVLCKIKADRDFFKLGTVTTIFWRVDYLFHFRKIGWDRMLQNQGPVYLDAGGQPHRFDSDVGGAPEGLLTANGRKLTPGDPVTYITVKHENKLPFAPLLIQESIAKIPT